MHKHITHREAADACAAVAAHAARELEQVEHRTEQRIAMWLQRAGMGPAAVAVATGLWREL